MIVLQSESVGVVDCVAVRFRLRRHRHFRAALFFEHAFDAAGDVVHVTRFGDIVVNRANVAATMSGVEDHRDAGEILHARANGEFRARTFRFFTGDACRIIGRQPFGQQQFHRNFHRVSDRNLRDVVDAVELHDAIDDVADILRVDAAGETDGDR